MNIEVQGSGAFDSARIQLDPGEQFVSESGAMYRADANVDIDVTTRSRGGGGGLLAGAKRLLARENFFFSTYRTTDGGRGEVGIAPTHQGQIRLVDISPDAEWYCAGGSYLGSTDGLAIDTEFQGFKGLFSGESLFFLRVSGSGQLLVSSFGRIVQMEVEEPLTVDTGHLVAFESSLSYTISKAGGSWLQSMLAGEGVVMHFTGRGRILTQSHNPKEFGTRRAPPADPPELAIVQYQIEHQPTYSALEIALETGEPIVAEAGAMAWMSANMKTETTTRGGVLRGLKRAVLAGESLFQNTYSPEGGPGEITLVPGSAGDVACYELSATELILEKGAYLASTEGVHCDAKWDGLKGLFNEGLFVLRVTGTGIVFFHSYGRLEQVDVDGSYVVDNGYAVAWEPSLVYQLSRGPRIRSFLFSDQLLLKFQGTGKVWVQSRSPQGLAAWVHPFRRVQQNNSD